MQTSGNMPAAHDVAFNTAKDKVTNLSNEPDNTTKLELYALFKQATVGKCNAPKPGAFDFVGKAKWQAWNDLSSYSQEDAQLKYIDVVKNLYKAEGKDYDKGLTEDVSETIDSTPSSNDITVHKEDKVGVITINRIKKKNSITVQMYDELILALQKVASDDNASIGVLTGAGDFYSSGNDLSNLMSVDPSQIGKMAKDGSDLLERFVNAFIDFPKPLVALVNGPAVGVAVTTLGLCDVVYATNRATFQTPMVALGQCAEGCSTFTFPRIMGQSRANEMLLFGKQISASQAYDWGLVTEMFPDESFQQEAWSKLKKLSSLPPKTLVVNKKLLRDPDRAAMKAMNIAECNLLEKLWQSPECFKAIMDFFSKKSKL